MLKTLVGRSGVAHAFDDVTSEARGTGVTRRFSVGVAAVDVVATYAMALDVGARSAVLVAPSCSAGARRLLEEYGMKLKIVP